MQTSLFKDLEKLSKNTLYIIGNGFDLAHGIHSSYSDFKEYVKSTKRNNIIELIDIFFSTRRNAWNDLETALGEYDTEEIFDWCRPDEEIDVDHALRDTARREDCTEDLFCPVVNDLYELFTQWVNDIDIETSKHLRIISGTGKYLTFNYTESLEKHYAIPADSILHIHGSRIDSHSKYIFGHNNLKNERDAEDEAKLDCDINACKTIICAMNEMYKDSSKIINANKTFFNSLTGTEQIFVLGHSLNKIDMPYFEKIIELTGTEIPWKISYYNAEDKAKIDEFISTHHLENVCKLDIEDEKYWQS